MASAEGRVCTPPVEPETTDTPSTVNSLFSVRLPLTESWLALMPVASPPEDTPAVRDSRLRMLRFGSGRACPWGGLMRFPREEVLGGSCPADPPAPGVDSGTAPGGRGSVLGGPRSR